MNSPGNFRTVEEARNDMGHGANCKVEVAIGQTMPPYCTYCARETTRTVMVPVSGWSKESQEVKAAGCLFFGFLLGPRVTRSTVLDTAGALSNSQGSKRDVSLPVCGSCISSYGAPLAEMSAKSRVTVPCCAEFQDKFERGVGMDAY